METIISRRSFSKFYLALLGIFCFCFVMTLMIVGIFVHDYHANYFQNKEYGLLIMAATLIIGFFYTLYKFIKKAPTISINTRGIQIGSTMYYWSDLENAELTAKRSFLFLNDKQCAILKFKDRDELVIFDIYSNTAELKHFIQCQISAGTAPHASLSRLVDADEAVEHFELYKGMAVLCFSGIMMWLVVGMFATMAILTITQTGLAIFAGLTAIGFFAFLKRDFYYFGISDNYLMVRNHYFFWKRKFYPLSDIRQIVFEMPYKRPHSMRIITNDFESTLYGAASIRNSRWYDLKEELEKRNIPIKDEFVSGLTVGVEFKLFD